MTSAISSSVLSRASGSLAGRGFFVVCDIVLLRQTEMVAFEGLLAAPALPSTGPGIQPPPVEGNTVVVKFPSTVTDCAGTLGFLVFPTNPC